LAGNKKKLGGGEQGGGDKGGPKCWNGKEFPHSSVKSYGAGEAKKKQDPGNNTTKSRKKKRNEESKPVKEPVRLSGSTAEGVVERHAVGSG